MNTIDYAGSAKVIDLRLKQISDAALENPYFVKEHKELTKIREGLTQLILLERLHPTTYNDKWYSKVNTMENKDPLYTMPTRWVQGAQSPVIEFTETKVKRTENG